MHPFKEQFFILGASDPEMAAIERLLRGQGIQYAHALFDGKPVTPGFAYVANGLSQPIPPRAEVFTVECAVEGVTPADRVDHHRPGDPGFGLPPADYWRASSIGQVWDIVRPLTDIPEDLLITAAADHCLGHAYRGRCPGVSPDALRQWRAETRAAFQNCNVSDIVAAVDKAIKQIYNLPFVKLSEDVTVAHATKNIPELPEASAITGIPVMYERFDPREKRIKIGLLGADADTAEAWLAWARNNPELTGVYGDPARGFAGAYRP